MKPLLPLSATAMLMLTLSACSSDTSTTQVGMSNPAAQFCVDQGGKVEYEQSETGDMGICHTVNGEQIEQWAYYRQANHPVGMANPAAVFCLDQGGELINEDDGTGVINFCQLPDGSKQEQWDYYRAQHAM